MSWRLSKWLLHPQVKPLMPENGNFQNHVNNPKNKHMKSTKFTLTVPVENYSDPSFIELYFQDLIESGSTIGEAIAEIVQFQIFEYHMDQFFSQYGDRTVSYMGDNVFEVEADLVTGLSKEERMDWLKKIEKIHTEA
jgi:hypothetical protein